MDLNDFKPIPNQARCQSCGMPLEDGFYGTLQGGQIMTEYCKFCFQEGGFTEPGLTFDEMLGRSVDHLQRELKFSAAEAEQVAFAMLTDLRRWKK